MRSSAARLALGLACAIAAPACLAAGAVPSPTGEEAARAPGASAGASASAPVDSPMQYGLGLEALHGTLTMPAAGGRVPVVLIIAGSGPTNRDGNSDLLPGGNDSLRMVAAALAQGGIASLRYDKRGIGASSAAMTREADLRFDTYVDDATGWARQLGADPRFSALGVVGHSEGALIGTIVAARVNAAAFVSLSGPGRPMGEIIRSQLRGKLPQPLAERNEFILRELEAGRTVADVPAPLTSLYRASAQPYLISQMHDAPPDELAKLTMPVALFQGDTDLQLLPLDAQLLAAARPGAELHLIAGMNHVLKTVPADRARQLASYSDPALPLSSELSDQMVAFLQRTFAGTPPR